MQVVNEEDNEYYLLQDDVKKRFRKVSGPMFTTNVQNLFQTYLNELPDDVRQHYNCHCCRDFINKYGGLVTIGDDGKTKSVFWNKGKGYFKGVVSALKWIVEQASVTGVFYDSNDELGKSVTNDWTHLAVENHRKVKYAHKEKSKKLEEFKMLMRGLNEYSMEVAEVAVKIVTSESVYRAEKFIDVAKWFLEVHTTKQEIKNSVLRRNLMWRYVANAPVGWAHIKSSMIGTLLDDIKEGYSFDVIKRRFENKVNPLQYLRPQAKPSRGNIQNAEKIVWEMGIENSLKRRFARLKEIQTIWKPSKKKAKSKKEEGVFGALLNEKKKVELDLPAIKRTWARFVEEVLPTAKQIKVFLSFGNNPLCALVTAEDMDAPPILQWDFEDNRNPVSIYLYHNGSTARTWNLSAGWVDVTGVCYHPSMWNEQFKNSSKGVVFLLDGAKDTHYENSNQMGMALFPETLKSQLHEIRATIEAYSKTQTLGGYKKSDACGYLYNGRSNVEVKVDGQRYIIDRWD